MSKQYKLIMLTDLFEIPADRLDDFIVELKQWVVIAKSTDEMLRTITEAIHEPYETNGGMIWIDDGKNDKKVTITVKEPPR